MIYTLMSSEVHRTSPSNPDAPQSASRVGRKRLADTIFRNKCTQL
jgi:hypothetical protein